MPSTLRHETVIALEALIRTHTSSFKAQDIQLVVSEAAILIACVLHACCFFCSSTDH